MILAIDTATTVCSVALSDQGNLISLRETSDKNAHSAMLTLLISELMSSAGISLSSLDAVAVSAGPGSYTGLRIGVATAKGLCYSLSKPMIAIPTLQAMANGMLLTAPPQIPSPEGEVAINRLFCPMIDARRMEVFCALYDSSGKETRKVQADIIDENSFRKELEENRIIFAGEGAEKCKPFLEHHKNSLFLDNFTHSAKYMIGLAEDKHRTGDYENLAYFEPFYLKEFVAGKPRVKGLV